MHPARREHQQERDQHDDEDDGRDLRLLQDGEARVLGLEHRRQHRPGPGDGRDRQRVDRGVASAARQPDLLLRLALPEDHGLREQEQDEPAGDLEGGERNLHRAEEDLACHDEEDQDGRGSQRGRDRDPPPASRVLVARDGQEDRDGPDRIDHGEEEDEGGDDIDHRAAQGGAVAIDAGVGRPT